MAQAHAGQMDAAIAPLQRTLQLDATNFEAAFNLGVVYIQKQQLEPAAAALRQSVTIYPEFARGHRALGETLLYQNKLDDAIAELRRAVELAPQEPIMHGSLAKALAAKGLAAGGRRGDAARAATGTAVETHVQALLNILVYSLVHFPVRGRDHSGCRRRRFRAGCCDQASASETAAWARSYAIQHCAI
jgi:tetratricopeptide (TPR) repeat protein